MSGETPATNAVSRVSSSRESLKPGMSSVTISTQKPIACSRRIVSRIGCEAAAELAVVAIVEALEIDFVEIDPRPQMYSSTCGVPLPFET